MCASSHLRLDSLVPGKRIPSNRRETTRPSYSMKILLHIIAGFILLTAQSIDGLAGIYKYRNAEGQLTFVDDKSKIPAQFRNDVTPIPESGNSLGGYDQPEGKQLAPETPVEQSQTETSSAKEPQANQTPVKISGNRVLVPVEVTLGNRTLNLSLLLDTGATMTVFHRDALKGLDLPSGKRYKARIAGGGMVTSTKIRFRKITIGPFQQKKTSAMVINLEGKRLPFDGMLGMDFLKSHPYQIDFENQLINWIPLD